MVKSAQDIIATVREELTSRFDSIPRYALPETSVLDPRQYPREVINCSRSLEGVRDLLSDMSLLQYQIREAKETATSMSVETAAEDFLDYHSALKEYLEIKEGTLRSHLQVLRGLMSNAAKSPHTYGDHVLDSEVDPG